MHQARYLSRRSFSGAVGVTLALPWPAAAQTPTSPPTVKIRIAYVPVVGAASVFVLAGAGWGAEAGLDVSLVRFESGPPAISALASGTIDAMAIGVAPVAVARAKGIDVKIIAAASTGGSAFVARKPLAEKLGPAGANLAAGFAAASATVGRPLKLASVPAGGVPVVALNHWLFKLNNVSRAHVQIVAMGIDAIQQALLTGAVDGGTLLEPTLTVALEKSADLRVIATSDEMFPGIPGVVIAVRGDFQSAHPEAVDRLAGLVTRANERIVQNPQDAAKYSTAQLGGGLIDAATLARAFTSKAVKFVSDPAAIEEPTKRLLDYQAEIGDFDKAPAINGLFDAGPYMRAVRK